MDLLKDRNLIAHTYKENIAKIVLNHHECVNGTGFPNGLSMQNIDTPTAIISVCNYFDNLSIKS